MMCKKPKEYDIKVKQVINFVVSFLLILAAVVAVYFASNVKNKPSCPEKLRCYELCIGLVDNEGAFGGCLEKCLKDKSK